MAKKAAPKKPQGPKVENTAQALQLDMVSNAAHENVSRVQNGLSDALLGEGQNPYETGGAQISQTTTLFKNLRWYMISNMRQLLSQCYVEIGLMQNVVDVPVDDAYRGGIIINSKQVDEEQIQDLLAFIEQCDDLEISAQTDKWNRLYGGAGTVIMTEQDPSTPLDISSLNMDSRLEFRDADMWELFWTKMNAPIDEAIDGTNLQNVEFYDYYGIRLHKSRVLLRKGVRAPSFIRPRLRGWGVSVCETLIRSINQYIKSTDLSFEVLDEFKLDIFKIKNLTNTLLHPGGEAKVRQRVALANSQKNYQNALTMDSEDDYVQKQLSFAGLADTMQGIRMQVASDMRMPLTKLFGISAQGFNSGEDDIENYNAMVESQIRKKAKFHILKMVKLRCQQMYGFVPDDMTIDFEPLRILSSEQEETVKDSKFNRLLQARQAMEITSEEFRDACNRDNLLSIQLEKENLAMIEGEQEEAAAVDAASVDEEGDGAEKSSKAKEPKKEHTTPKEAKEPKDKEAKL